MRTRHGLAVAWCGALAGGCAAPIHHVRIDRCPTVTTAASDQVSAQYLGVGGVLLRRGSDVILTAPLYSNPGLVEFAADHQVRSDPETIERLFPPDGRKARAILVGHSHYDHLMDVPYVALNLAPDADVYGSTTTVNLLASIRAQLQAKGHDVWALDAKAYDPWNHQAGEWVPIGTGMRVLAIRSEHSDQFELEALGLHVPFHMFRGEQTTPMKDLPEHPSGWPEGRVFAYLIDFLDAQGAPVFRVYYQDSGTNGDIGLPPAQLLEQSGRARVDLAIVCLGGAFERLDQHPESLVARLRPRYALLVHWEDFFVTQRTVCADHKFRGLPTMPELLGGIRYTEVQAFRERFDAEVKRCKLDTRSWLPCPTASTFSFPVGGGGIATGKATFDCTRFRDY